MIVGLIVVSLVLALLYGLRLWRPFRRDHPQHGKFVDNAGNIEFNVPWPGAPSKFLQILFHDRSTFFFRFQGPHELTAAEQAIFLGARPLWIGNRWSGEMHTFQAPFDDGNKKALRVLLSGVWTKEGFNGNELFAALNLL